MAPFLPGPAAAPERDGCKNPPRSDPWPWSPARPRPCPSRVRSGSGAAISPPAAQPPRPVAARSRTPSHPPRAHQRERLPTAPPGEPRRGGGGKTLPLRPRELRGGERNRRLPERVVYGRRMLCNEAGT